MISDGLSGLVGTWRLFVGDDDVSAYYDVSAQGFWRSFAAAIIALPVYVFLVLAQRHIGLEESLANGIVIYLVVWAHFPIVAFILTKLQGNSAAFVPWVVVHNWAVLALLCVQTIPYLLYVAGLIPVSLTASLLTMAFVFTIFVHYRVVRVATQAPMLTAFAMMCIHVLINLGTQTWIDQQFDSAVDEDIPEITEPVDSRPR
jgi:hypothetical protein